MPKLICAYTSERGNDVRIFEDDEGAAVMEVHNFEGVVTLERFAKRGLELFRILPSGVEVGPLHEKLIPGNGYFIRSSYSAVETLMRQLNVKIEYIAQYGHNSNDSPGEIKFDAFGDDDVVSQLKTFVGDGYRNGTWAATTLRSGDEVVYRNEHGKAVGGVAP